MGKRTRCGDDTSGRLLHCTNNVTGVVHFLHETTRMESTVVVGSCHTISNTQNPFNHSSLGYCQSNQRRFENDTKLISPSLKLRAVHICLQHNYWAKEKESIGSQAQL